MIEFTLRPQGAFSLDPLRRFNCGLMVATRRCEAGGTVSLAFPLDGTFQTVGVQLRATEKSIQVRAVGTGDTQTLRAQLERVLSLDHDGRPFFQLAAGDPVLSAALQRHPGFRPPLFYSPYVAAAWLVLTQRLQQSQAAALQARIALDGGDVAVLDGVPLPSFPRPETLLGRGGFPGVPEEKWRRLQAVASSALEGRLELRQLRALPYPEAQARLREIRGIGPWTADGILMRGCGLPDAMVFSEPAVHHAVARGYGLARAPSDEELRTLSERWRPFRAWANVLLTMCYFEATGGRSPRGTVRGRRQPRRLQATVA